VEGSLCVSNLGVPVGCLVVVVIIGDDGDGCNGHARRDDAKDLPAIVPAPEEVEDAVLGRLFGG